MSAVPAERPDGGGRPRWTPLAVIYLVLAIAGLVGTWTHNVRAILEERDFLGDWFQGGPAVSSLTTDLLVVAVAAVAFMIVEGRRLRMKRVWLVVLTAPFIALAFAFPLFLALRERTLAGRRPDASRSAEDDGRPDHAGRPPSSTP